ncbi:Bacteriophage tail assembly protein [Anaerohalosphaera lusitana]|uniref:Bacteriophage tail assembly protein n=1 Tax=Anaerohalosphaera lusitana TaxID=1936003 RepID=A0A1U9NJD5_9BACT|nr:terminase gpA endonuclease subunit [Anaerohalosphaera lusitana]AQT67935.1 Bacteriophage tail assembly protein [Anaerohalosphaera lusitana]
MAIDPSRLKPAELTRLLNSTSLGTVAEGTKIFRHRQQAGYRISSDGKMVNLFKYIAWLVDERHRPKTESEGPRDYEAMKEAARARNASLSAAGREIGELPQVVDSRRKQACKNDFRLFCESYFPQTFSLEWSDDHLRVIFRIEQAVLHGGLFAMAMPRGSGKSTLAETACLWALVYGHRNFVTLLGSDEGHALGMLESIKTELESNDLLLEDFPSVCYPIHSLDGIANRCSGQLYNGQRTQISWTANEIVLPTIEGSPASGAIIRVAGITGRIRGMKFKRPDGQTVRPSLVILDDPQTDESARSLSQCANRERILAGAVLGLAGPGKKISGIMPCTVIRPGDMADRILDREKHPEWNGERTKMVYSFPDDERLWDKYAQIRADSLREHGDMRDATEFYRQHQETMDAGAEVAWARRYNHDELSAIQHAMNLKLQDEAAFWAEYQNEPLPENAGDDELLTVDEIAQKLNGFKSGEIPIGCDHMTMFIDVQGKLLFYVVCAWESNFSGYVVDYGAYPDQKRRYFTLRDARPTLTDIKKGAGLEGSIYAGLESLTEDYLSREWQRDDGAFIKIDRCLIDANWGTSTDVVYQFCRQSQFGSVIFPSHGRYVGAASTPFIEYKKKRGDRVGHNWRIPNVKGKRAIRHVLYDTNYWKSFIHSRMAVPMGDSGCLSLYGRNPVVHQLFAEHLLAEYRVKTSGRGRTVDEWKLRPEANDNHWFDGIVGCAVAASIQGAVLPGTQTQAADVRKRIKLSNLKRNLRRH